MSVRPTQRTTLAVISVALLVSLTAGDARATYDSIETTHLRLIYNDTKHGFLARHTARCFENAFAFYQEVFDYRPSEKITVILDDSGDYNNGFAWNAPRNTIMIQIAPTNVVYETSSNNERVNHTMSHELAHITALDKATGIDNFFRGLFHGKVSETAEHPETILYAYLTNPRRSAPRWYQEGLAVFLETWLSGGLGRAQGPYDEMVFRAMVRDGSRFYDPLGLESEGIKIDFQGGANSYLYGTRFINYLGYVYSPDQLVEWVGRGEGSKQYYANQFKNVFGLPLGEAWKQWIEWEHDFQQANLDSIRQYDTTPYRDLSAKTLGSISRAYFDPETQKIYAALNYPGVVGHVASISTLDGTVERIRDIKGPALYFVTSLAYDGESKTIFYTSDNHRWRDLIAVDTRTKKSRMLFRDLRVGDLVFNRADGSIWGVRHFNGYSTLVRIPPPYDEWFSVRSWPYGQVVRDIDISPDGSLLSMSFAEISGRQSLRVARIDALLSGDGTTRELYDFGNSLPANFVFSPDGRYLYGTSYYTGVSNVWRFDVAADSMDVVSNCETGFFRPIPLGGDSLIVFRYSGEGFVPAVIHGTALEDVSATTFLGAMVAQNHPTVLGWNIGPPSSVDLERRVTREGPYSGIRNLGLASMYPVVEGYKDYAAVGAHLEVSDPGYAYRAGLTVSYTPTTQLDGNERLHASLDVGHGSWEAKFRVNDADFYDLVGPTKTSLKGYSAGLAYNRSLIFDEPRTMDLDVSVTGFGDLERLPGAQNVNTTFDKLLSAQAHLTYRHTRGSLGKVDAEKGVLWDLVATNDYVNAQAFPKLHANYDLGVPLPLHHASLWLRSSAGYSPRDRDEPFANFYFGGFGNNWVDHRTAKRYRESDSFPGVEINRISGTNYAKTTLEWNLPPLRFRRFGIPALYVTWARTALFSMGIVTNMDAESARTTLANAGAQIDFQIKLLSRMELMLSVGYAAAFEERRKPLDEFMFSLKIL